MRFYLLLLLYNYGICFSQVEDKSLKKLATNCIFHSNSISLHPFGIFMSRVSHNFQLKSEEKSSIVINFSNGNIWLPYVKTYNPLNEADRISMKNTVWHKREGRFDTSNSPAKTSEFHADGVIRQYQIQFNIPISTEHELQASCRMFSLDKGKIPYALLTSDQFIEWFHSNIAGGEDPFARKAYGLNQAKIQYKDEKGKTLNLKNGDFVFSGIDLTYYYYPNIYFFKKKDIYMNIGLQIGANVTKINPSMDIGVNSTLIKRIKKNNNEFFIGLSLSALRMKALNFGDGVQLSNKKYLHSAESHFKYVKRLSNRRYFSTAINWFIQSSYNKKSDFDYLVLTGERISTHWHYASSHLYKMLSAHTLTFSYGTRNIAYSMYLREDILVDNAPDIQTGLGIKLYIK